MAVIKKYIEFLREYNKLLERGSKNVYRQKDVLWVNEIENTSIVKQIYFDTLFSEKQESSILGSMFKVERPAPMKEDDLGMEEEVEKKFERDSYSFLYKAARDSIKDTGLEFVYSFGLFNIGLGEDRIKAHLFNIPLQASLLDSNVVFQLSNKFDPYIDAYFLNHPEINRDILENVTDNFDKGITEIGVAYLYSTEFKKLISESLLALHQSLVFDPTPQKPNESLTNSFISFSPCFILRRKRPRHFQNLMNRIIEFTDENDPELNILDILLGQRDNMVIDETPYFSQLYNNHKEEIEHLNPSDFEAFFPLPYNNEQLKIYQNYKTHDLSVVTGPPGTGKSHSIVNLLCAILAEGKRVLITAKTDKALESLLNKIPEQFSGLVMADINQQHGADYTLSNSIDSIRNLLLSNTMYSLERDLAKLNDEKRQYIEQRTEMVRALNREHESIKIDHFNKEFDIYELFEFLRNRYLEYEWIKDEVTTDTLEDNIEIIKKIKQLLILKNFKKKECNLDLEKLDRELETIDFDKIANLQKNHQNNLEFLGINNLEEYYHTGVDIILSNFRNYKNNQIKITDSDTLNRILAGCKEQVEIGDNIYVNCDPKELLENRARYKKDISTYLALIPKDKEKFTLIQRTLNSKCKSLKYLESITINDSFCNNKNSLIVFRKFIEDFSILNRQIDVLSHNNFIDYAPVSQLSLTEMRKKIVEGVDNAKRNRELLEITNFKEVRAFAKHYQIIDTDIEKLFEKAESLSTILKDAIVIETELESVSIAVEDSRKGLIDIGIKELGNNADVEKAKEWIAITRRQHSDYITFDSAKKFLLEKLPKTTAYLLKTNDNDAENYNSESLHLKLASYKIEDITSIDIEKTIQKLNYSFKAIQNSKANILSGLAKENFKNRFNKREKNEFVNLLTTFDREFKQSRRGIKDKEKFRRKAQQTAQKIAPNISCWVMKFDDVLKTIDERPQTFDCIIVDEASQLDFNSLLLGYYAQKMIVVGDEKQTSPESISIKDESFDSLRKRELSFMGDGAIHIRADASLFSLSQMVVGTTNQMLKEHFRCVPELIEFSKKHYYNDKIIPLKVISANRLSPKIVEYVRDGFVYNKEVPKEIDAIRNKLIEILSNPSYEDKSIGIVSLGSANHTRSLKAILETLPQRKLEKHNLIIDNPSEFQGDERDVIIVSLGVSIETDKRGNIKQPTSIVDNIENNLTPKLRGINVGLSRAKEQMILFHSVKLEELKTNDFRRHIISFFNEIYNPVEPYDLPNDLEKRHRMFENRPAPFDSWFEYDIAKALIENGYPNLVPQFEVKRKELFENPKTGETTYVHFKIDIVVYHNGMPLAIECDGDSFHSEVDDVAYDIERQEFLQRIGWKMHRITYSSFRIDPNKEIEKLLDFIKRNSPKEAPVIRESSELEITSAENEKEVVKHIDGEGEPERERPNQAVDSQIIDRRIKPNTASNTKDLKNISPPGHNLFSIVDESSVSEKSRQTDLFSNDKIEIKKEPSKKKVVEINSTCDIVMLDSKNTRYKVVLKDIARNLKPKTDGGILIVSIYDDLGKILLGNREGVIIRFPQRKQRIKIEKIY